MTAPHPSAQHLGFGLATTLKGPGQQVTAASPSPLLQHPRVGAHWIKTGDTKELTATSKGRSQLSPAVICYGSPAPCLAEELKPLAKYFCI